MTDDELARALNAAARYIDGPSGELVAAVLQHIPHASARLLFVLTDLSTHGWLDGDGKEYATQVLEVWHENHLPKLRSALEVLR